MGKQVYVIEFGRDADKAPAIATLEKETEKSYMFAEVSAQRVTGSTWDTMYVSGRSSKEDFLVCDTLAVAWACVLKARMQSVKYAESALALAKKEAREALLALEAAQKEQDNG